MQRSEALAHVLRSDTKNGWRVVSQTSFSAQLEKGKHTNHLLHLILSIITLGAWLIVWVAVVVFAGHKSRYVAVDEYGRITHS